jgi:hypothetical protein
MQAFTIEALEQQRQAGGKLYLEFLREPTLSVGLYTLAVGATDPQQPHCIILCVGVGRLRWVRKTNRLGRAAWSLSRPTLNTASTASKTSCKSWSSSPRRNTASGRSTRPKPRRLAVPVCEYGPGARRPRHIRLPASRSRGSWHNRLAVGAPARQPTGGCCVRPNAEALHAAPRSDKWARVFGGS